MSLATPPTSSAADPTGSTNTSYAASSGARQPQERSQTRAHNGNNTVMFAGSLICSALLVAIVFIGFARTLGSYFLADDFGEIAYANSIVHGRWDLFWLNWTGNYMQIPSMAVYRPLLMASLVGDQFLWHANAFGFYLTNLLYVAGDTLLVFAICKEISMGWKPLRRLFFALTSAALFAASPLHCESTSWVVGRVDTACCFFYLAALLLFLKHRRQDNSGLRAAFKWLSLALFVAAMLVKEMAIGLPVLVTAIAVLVPSQRDSRAETIGGEPGDSGDSGSAYEANRGALRKHLFAAAVEVAPFWIATVLYFVVRVAALGTIFGGYTGGIGDSQATSALANWLQLDIYRRLVLPLPYEIYGLNSEMAQILTLLYCAALTLAAVRAFSNEINWKGTLLLGIWTVTTLLPIYKLWSLGLNLEGSRFLFFLTAPMSVLLPYILLAPRRSKAVERTNQSITVTALIVLTAIFAILLRITTATDSTWVHAGREVRKCQQEAVALVSQLPKGKRIAVLGIPKSFVAAHMIYNGDTFKTMLRPPYATEDFSDRVVTFDPVLFGPSQFINTSRFKQTIADKSLEAVYVWNRESRQWRRLTLTTDPTTLARLQPDKINFPLNAVAGSVQIRSGGHAIAEQNAGDGILLLNVSPGDGLTVNGLHVNPLDFDFLTLTVRAPAASVAEKKGQDVQFGARWRGSDTGASTLAPTSSDSQTPDVQKIVHLPAGGRAISFRIPLSQYWKWFTQGTIQQIEISLPSLSNGIEVVRADLDPARAIKPTLSIRGGGKDDGTGVNVVTRQDKLVYDASAVAGAAQVQVETTPPNYFFDPLKPLKQDSLYVTYRSNGVSGDYGLGEDFCPAGGFTQVRIRALNAAGHPIGEYSDPVTLLVR